MWYQKQRTPNETQRSKLVGFLIASTSEHKLYRAPSITKITCLIGTHLIFIFLIVP